VPQDRAFGQAGGPGGVLDLRVSIRRDVRQALGRRPGAQEAAPVRERDHLSQAGKLAADLRQHLGQVCAAVGRRQHNPVAAGLAEHVRDPEADLEAARLDLAAWWQANLDKFRAQGILEDRSGVSGRP
jgi:hypothetical protein